MFLECFTASSTPKWRAWSGYMLSSLFMLTLLIGCQSKPVDIDTRRIARFEHAIRLGTVEAHQQFLNMFSGYQPVAEKFATKFKISTDIVQADIRKKLLTLSLEKQIDYLKNFERRKNSQFAFNDILTVVINKTRSFSMIEQIQWLSKIVSVTKFANQQNVAALRQVLGVPENFKYVSNINALTYGPTSLSYIPMAELAARMGADKLKYDTDVNTPELKRATAYLLSLMPYTARFRWVSTKYGYGRYSTAPEGVGTISSVDKEAAFSLFKIIGAEHLIDLATTGESLTRKHAIRAIKQLLAPESRFNKKGDFFPAILSLNNEEAKDYYLPMLDGLHNSKQLPLMLESVFRRVNGIDEIVPLWLMSNDWKQQTAAIYAVALFRWDIKPFEHRLDELAASDKRIVRQLVVMAKSTSEKFSLLVNSSDLAGTASPELFLKRLSRVFTTAEDKTYVDPIQQLATLDFIEAESASLTYSHYIARKFWPYPYGKDYLIKEFKAYYSSLRFALDPKSTVLNIKNERENGDSDNTTVNTLFTVAVLQREPELLPDPDAPTGWLLWPNIYYCYLDAEQKNVVGIYNDHRGKRLLNVPPDVAKAVKRILSRVGVNLQYPGVEGGLVLVVNPDVITQDIGIGNSVINRTDRQLLDTATPANGRKLSIDKTRLSNIIGVPFLTLELNKEYRAKTVKIWRSMSGDASKLNYKNELVFAPDGGTVQSIEDKFDGLNITLDSIKGTKTISHLAVVGIKVGAEITTGQLIGIRIKDLPR